MFKIYLKMCTISMISTNLSGFMSYKIICTMIYLIDGGSLVRWGQRNVSSIIPIATKSY